MRMGGVNDVYISKPARYILSIASIVIKKAEVLTTAGLRSGKHILKMPSYSVSLNTVSTHMKGVQLQVLKTSEVLTAAGLRSHRMLPASIIFQCIH